MFIVNIDQLNYNYNDIIIPCEKILLHKLDMLLKNINFEENIFDEEINKFFINTFKDQYELVKSLKVLYFPLYIVLFHFCLNKYILYQWYWYQ